MEEKRNDGRGSRRQPRSSNDSRTQEQDGGASSAPGESTGIHLHDYSPRADGETSEVVVPSDANTDTICDFLNNLGMEGRRQLGTLAATWESSKTAKTEAGRIAFLQVCAVMRWVYRLVEAQFNRIPIFPQDLRCDVCQVVYLKMYSVITGQAQTRWIGPELITTMIINEARRLGSRWRRSCPPVGKFNFGEPDLGDLSDDTRTPGRDNVNGTLDDRDRRAVNPASEVSFRELLERIITIFKERGSRKSLLRKDLSSLLAKAYGNAVKRIPSRTLVERVRRFLLQQVAILFL